MLASFGVMSVMLSISIIGVSLLLIGLVLLQKNRGSGLSGAFGGVGGHSAFGTKTGDFLTWVTVSLVAVFLLLNVVANYAFEPEKTPARSVIDAGDANGSTDSTTPSEEAGSNSPSPTSESAKPTTPASTTPTPAATPTAPAPAEPAGETAPASDGATPPSSN